MDWTKLLLALAVPTAGLIGYFGNRWIQKSSVTERIDRSTKVVGLHKAMREEGLSIDELVALEDDLSFRKSRRRQIEDKVQDQVMGTETNADDDILTPMTQLEMNFHAAGRAQQADLVLSRIAGEYRAELSEDAQANFDRAMDAWEKFVELQAEVESTVVEGGSMQPMVRASERERLTIQRAADLREQAEHRRNL